MSRKGFKSVQERNSALNNLAAADAAHDFDDMGRISNVIKAMKGWFPRAFHTIFNRKKDIGTLAAPTKLESEENIFKEITGLTIERIKSAKGLQHLTMLDLGDESITYEWKTILVSRKVDGEYQYESSSKLFEEITGSKDETSLYFMIDAVVTKIYEALVQERGTLKKKAYYISTREGINDSAHNIDMSPYVKGSKKGTSVSLEIIADDYPFESVYPAMQQNSIRPHELFNSIYTISLASANSRISKEGIHATILKFKKVAAGGEFYSAISQQGTSPNAVNSIYPNLMKLAHNSTFERRQDEYYTLLQQKRSGDWLQVLSSFDVERFRGVPKGMPVYVASEDRLCILYGLCVGANMIYTFRDGHDYYITVFRRDREPPPNQVEIFTQELQGYFGGHKDPETFAVGDKTFKAFFEKHVEQYVDILNTFFIPRINAALTGGVETGIALTRYDNMLKDLLKILINTITFYFGIPNPMWPATASLKQFLASPKQETLDRARVEFKGYSDVFKVLTDFYGTGGAVQEVVFIDAFASLFTTTPESERFEPVQHFSLVKPFYQGTYMGIIEQIAIFLKDKATTTIANMLRKVIHSAMTSFEAQTLTIERGKVKEIAVVKMNLAVLKYLLFQDETNLPKGSLPHLSVLLQNLGPGKNGSAAFSIQRILAKCFQKSVEDSERSYALYKFLSYFSRGGGPSGIKRSRPRSSSKNKTYYSHPLVTIWLYINFLNDILVNSEADSPRHTAAISIYEFIRAWFNAYSKFFETLKEGGSIISNELEVYRVYYDGLVSLLTTLIPNMRDMAGIIPPGFGAPDIDLEEITGTINLLIFGRREAGEDGYVREARMLYSLAFQAIQATVVAPITPTELMDTIVGILEHIEKAEILDETPIRSRSRTRKVAPKTTAIIAASRRPFSQWSKTAASRNPMLARSKTRKIVRTSAKNLPEIAIGV